MAKTGIQGLAAGRSDLFRIDPRLLTIKEGWNARDFDDPENVKHVDTLALSIREIGVQEPLTVIMEDGVPVVTNGESRLRAVRKLIESGVDIKTVPVQTEPRHASDADKLASQIIRNSGKPFTVLEQSRVFVRLIGYGWEEKDIAMKSGLTVERIRQIVALNALPAPVKKHIQSGTVSATMAQRAAAQAKGDGKKAAELIEAAVEKAKSEGRAKARPRDAAPAKPKTETKARVSHKDLLAELLSYADEGAEGEKFFECRVWVPKDRWAAIQAAVK